MSKRIFRNSELQKLQENQHVARVSERSVTYVREFKEQALRQYEQGMSGAEIFTQAGFDLDVIGRKQPKNCLHRWRKQFKKTGADGLIDTRGRNKAKSRNTETNRTQWLEAEVKYLKAENAFLAQLRAKRAE